MVEGSAIGEQIGLDIAEGPAARRLLDRFAREGVVAYRCPDDEVTSDHLTSGCDPAARR